MTPEQVEQATREFIAIYKEEFGIDLNYEIAAKKAQELLRLFSCLTRLNEV
jgi:hypothetical protein